MEKKIVFIVANLLILAMVLFAGGAQDSGSSTKSDIRIAIVTDFGGLGDQAYNDAGYRGLMKAAEDFGIEVKAVESSTVSEYETNFASVGSMGFDLVFGLGAQLSDAVRKIAPSFPDTMYIIIDGNVDDIANVLSINYREEQSAFLAGALAAKMTSTRTVGFVLGMRIPVLERFEVGFVAGSHYTDESVDVQIIYTGKFNDPGLGKESAFTLFGNGADIVAAAAGACNLGVFDAATQKGKGYWAMGAAAGQSHLAPQDIIADQVKRVDNTIYYITETFINTGSVENGRVVMSLAEDAVGLLYGENPAGISDEVFEYIESLNRSIQDGAIVVPKTYDELESFKAQ